MASQICQKIAKSSGKRCRNAAVDDGHFCHMHKQAVPVVQKSAVPVMHPAAPQPRRAAEKRTVPAMQPVPSRTKHNHNEDDDDDDDDEEHAPANNAAKAQCQQVCKRNGQQCKLSISRASETHCPRHGGLTKGGTLMKVGARRKPIPWAQIHAASLTYMLGEHAEQCQCRPKKAPCRAMQVLLWLYDLSNLVANRKKGTSTYPSAGSLNRWLAQAPNMSKAGLRDKIKAILGPGNATWLLVMLAAGDNEGEKDDQPEIDLEEDDADNDVDDKGKEELHQAAAVKERSEEEDYDEHDEDDEDEGPKRKRRVAESDDEESTNARRTMIKRVAITNTGGSSAGQ
jgi:hypothetical protein